MIMIYVINAVIEYSPLYERKGFDVRAYLSHKITAMMIVMLRRTNLIYFIKIPGYIMIIEIKKLQSRNYSYFIINPF
ncbi:hypothetical protein SDC9_198339 [bioreactor metagenome]|uniref:Uncharacterized protein n=1 Tax=bioreactor metagenome TaxID=1076179 RepID=A0A645IIA3_9ZZZZ